LIAATGIPKRTLARFELGNGSPQRRTIAAIQRALEAAGVEFIPENGGGAGVRLRKG
jgi:transcriptional regulator with XRE-family HTH domain